MTITFKGDQIGVNAGCNSMGGTWRLADGTLVVGPMATTEMACDPPLMDQDAWVSGLLAGATMTLDGDTLILARDGVTLTMGDKTVVDPSRPFTGTTWVLESILVGLDAVSSVPAGVRATITIVDGQASVAAGCNKGGASASVADGQITFGPLGLTKMACDPDKMGVEEVMAGVLSGTVSYTIDGPTLTILGSGNGLIFRAEP